LWDAATGEEVRQFVGHIDTVSSVAFSSDGRYVLTGSHDSTARLWDAATGEEVRQFVGHTNGVTSVAFSPDGRYVLTGSWDGTARLWETNHHDFIAYACSRIFRDFTDAQRQLYSIPDDEPTCTRLGGWANAPTTTPISTVAIPLWTLLPTLTPSMTPTPSNTPSTTPTFTPTMTPTPTSTPLDAGSASVGDNRGEIVIGGGQIWTYDGQSGETLTIRVSADHPPNDADDRTGLLDTLVIVRAPDVSTLAENDDIRIGNITDSWIEDLELPVDGIYEIEVRSWDNRDGGAYTLTIGSVLPVTPTPTRTPTLTLTPSLTPTPTP
jgi:WD40 repeat protein